MGAVMKKSTSPRLISGLFCCVSACTSHPNLPDGSGSSDSANGGSGDGAHDAATLAGPCPTKQPDNAAKTPCPSEGLQCEYGADPRPACRTVATCGANHTWQVPIYGACAAIPPATCPQTRDIAAGAKCNVEGAFCRYDGFEPCECTNCNKGGPDAACLGEATWHCPAPHPDARCPAVMPRLGEPCAQDGQVCKYTCGGAGGRVCHNGVWQAAQGGPCAISSRRAKRDIHYLDAVDERRVANEALALRLATYEYRDVALAGKRRLGFIIEDNPTGSPAVDRDGNMIDLYGYTSMLLAATKQQAVEIAALKRDIADLKRSSARKDR